MFVIKFYYSGILLVSLLNGFLKLQALWILPYEVVQMVHLKGMCIIYKGSFSEALF